MQKIQLRPNPKTTGFDMELQEFERLIQIMHKLRKQCPWDRAQTPFSLRQYILEEAYEAVEAIDEGNWEELKKELGDLLLQIVFQAEIARENQWFTLEEVIHHINEKLIERHPHVFGTVQAKTPEQVKDNWEEIKARKEKRTSLLQGVPRNMCALLRAQRVQEKASHVGFDWDTPEGILQKVREETQELEESIREKNSEGIEEEIGDLLFSMVNISRFFKINAEDALRKTTNKFISRFQYIERALKEKHIALKDASLEEMDKLWEKAKEEENNSSEPN